MQFLWVCWLSKQTSQINFDLDVSQRGFTRLGIKFMSADPKKLYPNILKDGICPTFPKP